MEMIKRLVRQMLTAQTLSALTVSLCLLIDNIMIGQFLGNDGLAAFILANPILLVIGAMGSMLSAGVQVACSKSLGKGSQEETNVGYSSALVIAAVCSIVFVLVVVLLRMPLARLMGANTPKLLADTGSYMSGFVIGAPASMGALILVPFLQMAGQSNLLIVSVLGMTIADVGFDYLNVAVLHGGMFGMGLASSLSYYVAIIIGGTYFLSKKSTFHFSLSKVHLYKIRELLAGGIPTIVGMAASVILVFVMNKILLQAGGATAVAAFAVITTLGNASNCISTGTGGVSLTLSGILYHEEDQSGLKSMLGLMMRYAVLLGVVVAALLIIFAPACVNLFMRDPGEAKTIAVLGLRLYALGLIPCCVNNALRSSYQGTGKVRTMEVIAVLENAALPALAAVILNLLTGMDGIWLYFLAGEVLAFIGIMLYVWIKKKKITFRSGDILLLNPDFGVPAENLLEADIAQLDDVLAFSQKANDFCRSHGQSARLSYHLALCIEEMGSNIVRHGFSGDNKKHHLSIRLQYKNGRWALRFRDDCGAFDPIKHIPKENTKYQMGIRLVMHMADEARYTYSMNLNNLLLVLREDLC